MPKATDRKKPQLPCLTGARFLAALAVVSFHFGTTAPLGRQAVSFFFILSGLVLAYTYHDSLICEEVTWPQFMNLRLGRILPMHIVGWLVATALLWGGSWKSWAAGLLCVQVYWPSRDLAFAWNGPAWSISCELFFYTTLPFLVPRIARLRSTSSVLKLMATLYAIQVIMYLGSASILLHRLEVTGSVMGYSAPLPLLSSVLMLFPLIRLPEFLIGCCLGILVLRKPSVFSPSTANLALLLSGLAYFTLIYLPWSAWGPFCESTRDFLIFVPAATIATAAFASGTSAISLLLELPSIVLLGEASYSLYMIHWSAFIIFVMYGRSSLAYLLCLHGALAASVLCYRYIETPARNWWRRQNVAHNGAGRANICHSSDLLEQLR